MMSGEDNFNSNSKGDSIWNFDCSFQLTIWQVYHCRHHECASIFAYKKKFDMGEKKALRIENMNTSPCELDLIE